MSATVPLILMKFDMTIQISTDYQRSALGFFATRRQHVELIRITSDMEKLTPIQHISASV